MTLLLEEDGVHKYQEGKGVLLEKVKMIRGKASKPLNPKIQHPNP